MLGHGLLRCTIGTVDRLTRRASSATFTLLAGLAVLVFAFLPGCPYRLEQYDLPKDVAPGILGGA
jgi:hypothetical protein